MDPLFTLPQKPSILDLYSVPIAQLGNAFSGKLMTKDVRLRQDYGVFKLTASNIILNMQE